MADKSGRSGERGGAGDDSDEDADFEDAEVTIQTSSEAKLLEALEETREGLHLFLDNKFEEATLKVAPLAHTSVFHSIGNSSLHFVKAMMTSDPHDIDLAAESIKTSVDLFHRRRRQRTFTNNSVTKIVKKTNYNLFTEEEAQVELLLADSLMLKTMISLMQDESLVSLVKSGIRIRSVYMMYKECDEMLKQRKWPCPILKRHFESGVLMGIGCFHLGISGLPSKVLKLLEFVGMSGSKEIGLQKLDAGQKMFDTLRGPLCTLIVLMYHTMFSFAFGSGNIDVPYSKSVLQPLQASHPMGTITLYHASRIEEIEGNVEEATNMLLKALSLQGDWKQIKHVCYWELTWCYIFTRQWYKSQQCMAFIQKESQWSKTITSYLLASVMSMRKDLSNTEHEHIVELMTNAPSFKRRIAGKSMPMEKFICRRVTRYSAQNKWLFLPIIEALYNFNYLSVIRKKAECMTALLAIIERAIEDLVAAQSQSRYFGDNYCLGLLLKGSCLRHLKSPLQAEDCFKELFLNEKKIEEDFHLIPFSLVELGFMFNDLGNGVQATHYFELAKTYKKISMESRLHLRIHAGLAEVKEASKSNRLSTPSNGSS